MEDLERYHRFESAYRLISWGATLASILFVLTSGRVVPETRPLLLVIAALFGIVSLVMTLLLPLRNTRVIRYGPDDKVLVESLLMILLLAGFMFYAPPIASGTFLFLIPVLIEATVLHERIILAETAFAAIAILFLRIASAGLEPVFSERFVVEALIFLSVVALMFHLTRRLRRFGERNQGLAKELSDRLDQIHVISVLVQQAEFFPRFDTLLERIGEILSDTFDTEECGFFLRDGDGALRLHGASVGFRPQERRTYAIEENLESVRKVLSENRTVVVNSEEDAEREKVGSLIADRHRKNFMMIPLGHRDRRTGLLMLANKRNGGFTSSDLTFLQLLTGFVSNLIDSAESFRHVEEERESAERMSRLLVGRELRMRELKKKANGGKA